MDISCHPIVEISSTTTYKAYNPNEISEVHFLLYILSYMARQKLEN